jgi:23S rRNA (pseudouridine1915-N3)-methyltransferase
MVNIIISSIGKETETWQSQALSFYTKRIRTFATLKDQTYPTPKRLNRPVELLKAQERESLISALPKQCFTYVLDERGQVLTSQKLAQSIEMATMQCSNIAFLLGGPDGHAPQTRDCADKIIALSAFTLPHILAKIMLCEQVYRALSIIHQHPYHR